MILTTPPLIIAHRGYSSSYRENSTAAWIGALAVGADVVEIDIRATADLDLVCAHDTTLSRLTGRAVEIASASSKHLAEILIDGEPAAPLLEYVFDTLPTGTRLLLDVKDERPVVLGKLIETLRDTVRDDLVLGLHAAQSIEICRGLGWSGTVLGLLIDMREEEAAFAAGCDLLRLWESDANDDRIASSVERGRSVWVTTGEHTTGRLVGDFAIEPIRRMARAGVAGFLVNDPKMAREALVSAASQPKWSTTNA